MREPEEGTGNCGQDCFERRLRAWLLGVSWEKYLEDSIVGVIRTTLRWATDEPLPDTETLQRFPNIDKELLATIRGALGGPRGIQEVEPLCPEECFCDIPSDAEPLHVNVVERELEEDYQYVTRRFLAPDGNGFRDALSGEPVEVDPETDFLGEPFDFFGQPNVELFTRYTASVKFYARLERIELRGTCRPLGEPDDSGPEHA